MLPVFVELVGHQPVERFPGDAAGDHVVHQPRQIAGQRQRRGRARRPPAARRPDSWPTPPPAVPASGGARVRRASAERPAARRRRIVRRSSANASSSSSISPSATMRGRIAASGLQLIEKDFPRQPLRAPGRQIERRLREIQRILPRLETVDQPAIDQRRDDGAQQRHGDGNAENAHGLPDSRSGANIGSDYRDGHGVRECVHHLASSPVKRSASRNPYRVTYR